jgi:hypothetical protein
MGWGTTDFSKNLRTSPLKDNLLIDIISVRSITLDRTFKFNDLAALQKTILRQVDCCFLIAFQVS